MSNNREGVFGNSPGGNCRFVSSCVYYLGRQGKCHFAYDIASMLAPMGDKVRWETCNGDRFLMTVERR